MILPLEEPHPQLYPTHAPVHTQVPARDEKKRNRDCCEHIQARTEEDLDFGGGAVGGGNRKIFLCLCCVCLRGRDFPVWGRREAQVVCRQAPPVILCRACVHYLSSRDVQSRVV